MLAEEILSVADLVNERVGAQTLPQHPHVLRTQPLQEGALQAELQRRCDVGDTLRNKTAIIEKKGKGKY